MSTLRADLLAARKPYGIDTQALEQLEELGLRTPPTTPATLLYDIETTPTLAWVWGYYQTNVLAVEADWYMLSFAYKWLGDDRKPSVVAIDAKPDPEALDRNVATALWALFDAADVVIAHNGDRFDQKRARTRFRHHDLPPNAPFKEVDTLKEERRYFGHLSYKLNELGRFYDLGTKVAHHGMKLWFDCMAGDPDAWRTMKRYNVHDVELLESLWVEGVGWYGEPGKKALPNAQLYTLEDVCPKCSYPWEGKTPWYRRRGYYYTSHHRYPKLQCRNCGGYSRAKWAAAAPPATAV